MQHNCQRVEGFESTFDWVTFSNTLQIASTDNWSRRLKLILSGLSFWLDSLWIAIPTMHLLPRLSERVRADSSHSLGNGPQDWRRGWMGFRRTVSWLPVVLKLRYSRRISRSIPNLYPISDSYCYLFVCCNPLFLCLRQKPRFRWVWSATDTASRLAVSYILAMLCRLSTHAGG